MRNRFIDHVRYRPITFSSSHPQRTMNMRIQKVMMVASFCLSIYRHTLYVNGVKTSALLALIRSLNAAA